MISYVKIYGPPILKALKALEKDAIDMPEVCIMDTSILAEPPNTMHGIISYFGGGSIISEKRCNTIISKSGETLGEYDFFFEWFKKPTMKQLEDLIEKVDEALTPLNVKYTITSK